MSKVKILKMPCLDLKQAAFDKKLDFYGDIHSISEFHAQRFSIFHSLNLRSISTF